MATATAVAPPVPTVDPTPGAGDVTSFPGKPSALGRESGSRTFERPSGRARQTENGRAVGTRDRKTFEPPEDHSQPPPVDPTKDQVNPEFTQLQRNQDPFAEIDKVAGGAEAEAEPASAAEEEIPLVDPTDEPLALPGETVAPAKADTEEADEELPKDARIEQVRHAHKEQAKKAKLLAKELSELKKAPKTTEIEPQTVSELKAAKARLAEQEAKIRELDYTRSAEFKEKFVKPIETALEQAYSDVTEMTVTDESGNIRTATKDDFAKLLGMPLEAATKAAKESFGDMAGEVLAHRRAFVQAQRGRAAAVAEAGRLAEDSHKRSTEAAQASQAQLVESYKAHAQDMTAKLPQYFAEREGDEEGNKYLRDGYALISKAAQSSKLPQDQQVALAANIHMRAAAMPRLALDVQRLKKENATLKAQLKSFEASEPHGGDPGARANGATEKSWEAEIDRVANKRR